MIVRDRPSGIKMFLLLRGSVLPRILPALLVCTLIAIIVTWSHGDLFRWKVTLTTIPFTLIGLPLAIFLGFRNNAAYGRFWEGRRLWGEIVYKCRILSRQCQSLMSDDLIAEANNGFSDIRIRMIYRSIAFAHALRHYLRDTDPHLDIKDLLLPSEYAQLQMYSNKPDFLMLKMGEDLGQCLRDKKIDSNIAVAIDSTISDMSAAAAACERIKSTPIPFSYTLLLHRTAYIYCFLLPFGLVDSIGLMTPFVVAVVAYTFFGLDALGDEIEEPFGMESNDLPLSGICRSIEINLRESIKDRDIPAPLVPVNYCLS